MKGGRPFVGSGMATMSVPPVSPPDAVRSDEVQAVAAIRASRETLSVRIIGAGREVRASDPESSATPSPGIVLVMCSEGLHPRFELLVDLQLRRGGVLDTDRRKERIGHPLQ